MMYQRQTAMKGVFVGRLYQTSKNHNWGRWSTWCCCFNYYFTRRTYKHSLYLSPEFWSQNLSKWKSYGQPLADFLMLLLRSSIRDSWLLDSLLEELSYFCCWFYVPVLTVIKYYFDLTLNFSFLSIYELELKKPRKCLFTWDDFGDQKLCCHSRNPFFIL